MKLKRILSFMLIFALTIVTPIFAEESTNWTTLGKAFETDLNDNQNMFYLKIMEGIITQGNLSGNNSTNAKYNEVKAKLVEKTLVKMLEDEITAAQNAKSSLHAQFVKDEITMLTSMKPELKKSFEPLVAKYTALDTAVGTSNGTKQLIVKPKGKDGKPIGITKSYDKLPDYKAIIAPRIIEDYILVGQGVYESKWPAEAIITIEPIYEKVEFDKEGWIGAMPYRLQAVDEKNEIVFDKLIANSNTEVIIKAPKVKGYTTIGQTTKKVTFKTKFTPVVFNVKKVALPDLTKVTKKNDEVCPLLFVDEVMKDQRLVRDEVEIRQDGSCFRIQVYENDALVNLHREKSKLGKQVVKLEDYLNTFTEYGYAGTQPDEPTDQKIDKPISTLEDVNKPEIKDGEAKIVVIYYDEVEKKEINRVEKDKLKFGKYTIKPQAPKDYYLLEDRSVEIELTAKEPTKEIKYMVRPNTSGSATVTIYHVDIDANEIIKEEILKNVPIGSHEIKPYPFNDYDPAFSGNIKFTVTKDGEKIQKVAKYYKYLTKSERSKIGKYNDVRNYNSNDKPNKQSKSDEDADSKKESKHKNKNKNKKNKDKDSTSSSDDSSDDSLPSLPSLPDIFPKDNGSNNPGQPNFGKVPGLIFKSGSYMKGYPDGTFKPSNNLTRAEAAVLLANVLQGLTFKEGEQLYSEDLHIAWNGTPKWAVNSVATLLSKKHPLMILNVDLKTNGGFRANQSITREEFLDALVRAYAQVNGGNIEGSDGFSDTIGSQAHSHISFAKEKGLVKGYPDGTFKPNNLLTRAEAVAMVNAFVGIQPVGGPTNFGDVPTSHWAAGQINAATR